MSAKPNPLLYQLGVSTDNIHFDNEYLTDPFIHKIIRPRGWRAAWSVLRGRYQVEVNVSAPNTLFNAVYDLDREALAVQEAEMWDAVS